MAHGRAAARIPGELFRKPEELRPGLGCEAQFTDSQNSPATSTEPTSGRCEALSAVPECRS
jgi:hypothetical protein